MADLTLQPPTRHCVRHGVPCHIETNNYECRDYVCGQKEDRCDFRVPVKKVEARSCPKHPRNIVSYERIAQIRNNSVTTICRYYRCNRDRKVSGPWWCGCENAEEINDKKVIDSKTAGVELKVTGSIDVLSVQKIDVLEHELQAKRKLITNVKLSALPDGGSKIKSQIDELVSSISELKLSVASRSELDDLRPSVTAQNSVTATSQNIIAWPTTKSTFYDGVETTDTRRDLLSLAIERIHSSMESKPKKAEETKDPQHLKVSLMPHQRSALSWLLWREKQHPSGGIIADDMGLGKTLTMIALILMTHRWNEKNKIRDEIDRRSKQDAVWTAKGKAESLVTSSVTLVVCPASLLHHWEQEVKKYCDPSCLKVQLFYGPNRRDLTISRLLDCDIIVTTYDIIRCEITPLKSSKSSSVLQRIEFERIILDEGHVIKNPKSNTSLSTCTLAARSRWIVTGTPIHNKLTDMYSLIRFLRCSPFDDFKVWKCWVDNRTPQGQQRLATVVSCILLRRTKSEVGVDGKPLVILPSKTIHNIELNLEKEESEVYLLIFDRSKAMLESYLNSKKDDNTSSASASVLVRSAGTKTGPKLIAKSDGSADNAQGSMVRILVQLLRLRQCCCHLSLLREALHVTGSSDSNDDPFDDIVAQMQGLNLQQPPADDGLSDVLVNAKSGKLGAAFEISHRSTKIKALLAKLKEFRDRPGNAKSVVVSQWTSMLNIVAFHLRATDITFCQISGNVPVKNRSQVVEDFNGSSPRGPLVMLLSLKAGGVGLNLTGGSHLFFLDLHWNPALESQAADRIHRMGQSKDVHIYRFICKETIETKIVALQKSKLSLAKNVVEGGESASKSQLTLKDMKQLFGMS